MTPHMPRKKPHPSSSPIRYCLHCKERTLHRRDPQPLPATAFRPWRCAKCRKTNRPTL